jgi:hypothetical protein
MIAQMTAHGLSSDRCPQTLYDKAKQRSWIVISMKNDWKHVFAFQGK